MNLIQLEHLLTEGADEIDIEEALEAWRWLVPQQVTALAVTAFGDMFLVDPSGAVLFLDTIAGACMEVAASVEEWRAKIQEPELLDEWFMPGFLNELRQAGKHLSRGKCYSARHSTSLGGSFSVENFEQTFWRVHIAYSGQLHEKIKDLPPGTKITKINFTPL